MSLSPLTRRRLAAVSAGVVIALSCFIVAVWMTSLAADRIVDCVPGPGVICHTDDGDAKDNSSAPLPACPTEDSTGCYWDASEHGNGEGHDVVNAPEVTP